MQFTLSDLHSIPCQFVLCEDRCSPSLSLHPVRERFAALPAEHDSIELAYFHAFAADPTREVIDILLASLGKDNVDTVLSVLEPGVAVLGAVVAAGDARAIGHLLRLRVLIRTFISGARSWHSSAACSSRRGPSSRPSSYLSITQSSSTVGSAS
jgi:hypothetical protein